MAENPLEFENSQEQLRLSALINRFCDRKAEEFDSNVHVDEAREIIRILAPKIKSFSNRYWAENFGSSSDKTTTSAIRGVTNLGEVTVTTGSKSQKELKPNISLRKEEVYRIGAYMVTKIRVPGGFVVLNFRHFMKHGVANRVMGIFPPYWQIFYDPKSLEPTTISETQSKVKEIKMNVPFFKKTFRHISETPNVVYTTLGKKKKFKLSHIITRDDRSQ